VPAVSHDILVYPGRGVIMSDIQQYLLDFDRSKKEATETAQRSATRMYELLEGSSRQAFAVDFPES
jgi:predicted Ser/Thr protein kinase